VRSMCADAHVNNVHTRQGNQAVRSTATSAIIEGRAHAARRTGRITKMQRQIFFLIVQML
jgi:hypothetical protein